MVSKFGIVYQETRPGNGIVIRIPVLKEKRSRDAMLLDS